MDKQRVKLVKIRQVYQDYATEHGENAALSSLMEISQIANLPPVIDFESK